MKIVKLAILTSAFIFLGNAYAVTSYTQFGRYLTVTNAPHGNDPYGIKGTVERQFPDTVKTIGEAVEYTLQNTGYKLLPVLRSSASVRDLYNDPLPVYLRSIGPTSLVNALASLSGQAYQVVIDPVHRVVSYRLRPNYQSL